jgi:Family of unknown function (DUF6313)
MVRVGVLLAVVFVALFALGIWQLGSFWAAYAVLIGGQLPQATAHPLTALFVSLMGWLAVPAVVGAVAGVVVEHQVNSHQNEPLRP